MAVSIVIYVITRESRRIVVLVSVAAFLTVLPLLACALSRTAHVLATWANWAGLKPRDR